MPLPEHVNDREFQKFVESTANPGVEALRVTNPDGSNIGGSGGTAMLDDSAFTPGGSSVTPAGFLADDTSPDPVDENDVGAARMRRTTRAQYVEPVDQSGDSAMDDATNAVRVNVVAGGPATQVGAANFATGQVTVDTTADQIAAARATRRSITIVSSGATDVYLGGSGVTTATGLLLPGVKGAAATLYVTGAVHGITASGSQALSYVEEYD